MLVDVGAVLHRIEALPGAGRYAITFRRDDGGEHTAVLEVALDGVIALAEANLPSGWTADTDAFRAVADAIRALHRARRAGPAAPTLVDVDGGWDVGLGNVVLGADSVPSCTAHGPMDATGDVFGCAECGARARLTPASP